MGNAADPQQVKEAEIKERFNAKSELKDLAAILELPHGRRFLWRVLEKANVFNAGFAEPGQLMFREGKRDLGVWLMSEIVSANPDALINMMKEGKKDE